MCQCSPPPKKKNPYFCFERFCVSGSGPRVPHSWKLFRDSVSSNLAGTCISFDSGLLLHRPKNIFTAAQTYARRDLNSNCWKKIFSSLWMNKLHKFMAIEQEVISTQKIQKFIRHRVVVCVVFIVLYKFLFQVKENSIGFSF